MPVVEYPRGLSLPKLGEISYDKSQINVDFIDILSLVGSRIKFTYRIQSYGYKIVGKVVEEEEILGTVNTFGTVGYRVRVEHQEPIGNAPPELLAFQDEFDLIFHHVDEIETTRSPTLVGAEFIETEDWLKLVMFQQQVSRDTRFMSQSKQQSRKGWFGDRPGHSLAARGRRVPWKRRRPRA